MNRLSGILGVVAICTLPLQAVAHDNLRLSIGFVAPAHVRPAPIVVYRDHDRHRHYVDHYRRDRHRVVHYDGHRHHDYHDHDRRHHDRDRHHHDRYCHH